MIVDDRKRVVGKVVGVSAEKLTVELLGNTESFRVVGYDDVHYVARLGTFVMIPVLADYVVGEVVGLTERDFSRRDAQEAATLDKAGTSRFLDVIPVGTLSAKEFRFGVPTFPTLYTDALYATHEELDRIFEVKGAEESIDRQELNLEPGQEPNPWPTRLRALDIGRSAVFTNYDVKVKVDEFFGGHVAVLGNTGSGKSCTVSSIIQSLFEKEPEYVARGATFVVLDVNGEYRRAFSKLPAPIKRIVYRVTGNPNAPLPAALDAGETVRNFILPHWFMSVEEWELLLMASDRTQRPVLRAALGLATLFSQEGRADLEVLKDHILAKCLLVVLNSDASTPSKYDHVRAILASFGTDRLSLDSFTDTVHVGFGTMGAELNDYLQTLNQYLQEAISMPEYRHREFEFAELERALDLALLHEEAHGNNQIRSWSASMLTRFKWVRDREEFGFLRVLPGDMDAETKQAGTYLQNFLGLTREGAALRKDAQVIILDLNENEDDAVAVIAAVVGRLLFELLRKADPRNVLPINLVLEEAHRYIAERNAGQMLDASRIFERIAKEGRKYGMFLTVASQRPSELSRTVLSQCSNFVIHRIQNPEDLSHIRQMTPFMSEAVLRRLPSLPKQHALVFGNAVNMPMTVRVRDAVPVPHSADAEISRLWFHAADKPIAIPNSFGDGNPAPPEGDVGA